MAANQDKVEEKAIRELRGKIKDGKSSSEVEKDLNTHDVAYKIKNHTGKSS